MAPASDPGKPEDSLWLAIGIMGLYALMARLSLVLAIPPGYATAFWPAAGLAQVAVLHLGNRALPGVWLGSFLGVLWARGVGVDEFLVGSGISTGATLQAWVGRTLVLKLRPNFPLPFWRLSRLLPKLLVTGPLACVVSASLGCATLVLADRIDAAVFAVSWFTWWLGDCLGIFLVLPVAMLVLEAQVSVREKWRVGVPVVVIFSLVCLGYGYGQENTEKQLRQELDTHLNQQEWLLQEQFGELRGLAASLRSLYGSSQQVSDSEFQAFTADVSRFHHGLLFLAYAPYVQDQQRQGWLDATRNILPGVNFYEYADGAYSLRMPADYYYPVRMLHAHPGVTLMPGFDLASEDLWMAMEHWRDQIRQGKDPGPLLQRGSFGNFRLILLVVDAIQPQARNPDYTVAGFDLEPLLMKFVATLPSEQLLSLYDAQGNLLFTKDGVADGAHFRARSKQFTVDGQVWDLELAYENRYVQERLLLANLPLLTLSLLVCALIGVLLVNSAGIATELVLAEAQHMATIREDRSFLETLIDNLPMPLSVKDARELRYIRVNQALEKMYGFPREQILGKTDAELFPSLDVSRQYQRDRGVIASGRSTDYREETLRFSDSWYWIRGRQIPLSSGDGVNSFLLSLMEDITERKQHEAAFNTVVENLPNALLVVSEQGTIRYANPVATALFGLTQPDTAIDTLIPLPVRDQHRSFMTQYFSNPQPRFMGKGRDLFGNTCDGRMIPIEVGLAPISWRSEKAALVLITDISERKAMITALQRSNEELNNFAHIASHDLKEPVRGLTSYASFLLEDYRDKLDADGQKMLQSLVRLSTYLERMISELLQYSKLGQVELALGDTNTETLVEEIMESLRPRFNELNVHCDIVTDMPTVYCDRVRVAEVFRNLITNAMKYNDKEQRRVDVGVMPGTAPPVFFVRDNGVGIPLHLQDRIFLIFKRLQHSDQYGEGAGVGLSIVKKIIDRHGGRIWIDSRVGEGSTFFFTLASA